MSRTRKQKARWRYLLYEKDGIRWSEVYMDYLDYRRAYDVRTGVLLHEWVNMHGGDRLKMAQPTWERLMGEFVKKALAARKKFKLRGTKAEDEKAFAEWPAVREFLADEGTEKEPRSASSLTLSKSGGVCKATMRENDEGLVLFVSAASFYDVFEALEAQLESECPDWRQDKFAQDKKKGKK